MQAFKNITFICITLKKRFCFETDMDIKWKSSFTPMPHFQFKNVACNKIYPKTKNKKWSQNHNESAYTCQKASICSSIVLESHRLKTVYYMNKLH